MSAPTSRLLMLLSLLQTRRDWPGPLLAERLGVSHRTVRRDVDRLRELGYVNAFAGSTMPNAASVALFESRGFRKVAHWERVGFKAGAWHDVAWWQLAIQEPTVPPPELVS